MAELTAVGGGVSFARGSAVYGQRGARWDSLLGYLAEAGLCDQQLRHVEDMLVAVCLGDIEVSICRAGGSKHDLTIPGYETAAGLKKRLARDWAIQISSLQLLIGSRCLLDSDVIGEFMSSTDRVVTAVVSAPRALQDLHQSTQQSDKIEFPPQLEAVAGYMDQGESQHLRMLWDHSSQWAGESCRAAALVFTRLMADNDDWGGNPAARERIKHARRLVREVIVKRVEGWQLCERLDRDKMRGVFEVLALDAGWKASTVTMMLNAEARHRARAIRNVLRPCDIDASGDVSRLHKQAVLRMETPLTLALASAISFFNRVYLRPGMPENLATRGDLGIKQSSHCSDFQKSITALREAGAKWLYIYEAMHGQKWDLEWRQWVHAFHIDFDPVSASECRHLACVKVEDLLGVRR